MFEWAGSFALKSGIHTLHLGRKGAAYPDPSMRVAVLLQGSSHLKDVKDVAKHVMELEWDDAKCTLSIAILGTEDCPMTLQHGMATRLALLLVPPRRPARALSDPLPLLTNKLPSPGPGGVMMLDASMKPRSYELEMDKEVTATIFKINVTSPGTYGIFAEVCAQHSPALDLLSSAMLGTFRAFFAGHKVFCDSDRPRLVTPTHCCIQQQACQTLLPLI